VVASASLYEKIGGGPAVREVVDAFYTDVLGDTDLKPYFDGIDMARLKRHMVVLLCSVLGGPEGYRGRELGEAHKNLGISDEHYAKVGDKLVTALRDHNAGEDVVQHVTTVLNQVRPSIVEKTG